LTDDLGTAVDYGDIVTGRMAIHLTYNREFGDESVVPEMTYYVSSELLNSTQSLGTGFPANHLAIVLTNHTYNTHGNAVCTCGAEIK